MKKISKRNKKKMDKKIKIIQWLKIVNKKLKEMKKKELINKEKKKRNKLKRNWTIKLKRRGFGIWMKFRCQKHCKDCFMNYRRIKKGL